MVLRVRGPIVVTMLPLLRVVPRIVTSCYGVTCVTKLSMLPSYQRITYLMEL